MKKNALGPIKHGINVVMTLLNFPFVLVYLFQINKVKHDIIDFTRRCSSAFHRYCHNFNC